MSHFTRITHEWEGTDRIFVPQGSSPYDLTNPDNDSSGTILVENFDVVTVESVWLRPAFDYKGRDGVMIHVPDTVFFYVRSHKWGHNGGTHVTARELPLSNNFDQKASAS